MSTERDDLENKKKDQKRKEQRNNLMKAGGILLTLAGIFWGHSKGKNKNQ